MTERQGKRQEWRVKNSEKERERNKETDRERVIENQREVLLTRKMFGNNPKPDLNK